MVADAAAHPLSGIRVIVTREEGPDGRLSSALTARGATVLNWPAVRTAPPPDAAALDAAIARATAFDWAVFTSRRAVAAVLDRLAEPPPSLRVAAVGRSTGDTLAQRGWVVHLVPASANARGLVDALAAEGVGSGTTVFFPASEIASRTVSAALRDLGAEVVQVTAYRTLPASLDRAACRAAIENGVDVVTFASPSAVKGLQTALGDALFDALVARVGVAAIGSTTAAAAREAGAVHVFEATETTFEGLADRIVAFTAGTEA